jgi:hypothetical protein
VPSVATPCIHARLHRLATNRGEKSGLKEFFVEDEWPVCWCARKGRKGKKPEEALNAAG